MVHFIFFWPGVAYFLYLTLWTGLYVCTTSLAFFVIASYRRAAST